jgi:hypothetical protein
MKPDQAAGLTCAECGRHQDAGERGWRAYLTTDEDEPAEAIVYIKRPSRSFTRTRAAAHR